MRAGEFQLWKPASACSCSRLRCGCLPDTEMRLDKPVAPGPYCCSHACHWSSRRKTGVID